MDYEAVEEIKRHINVVAEALRADFRVAIEGLPTRRGSIESKGGSSGSRDDSTESRASSEESRR